MKDKILLFVIGVLVGAVVSTGAFYIYTNSNGNDKCRDDSMIRERNNKMNGERPPEMPDGENGFREMPNDKNMQDSR